MMGTNSIPETVFLLFETKGNAQIQDINNSKKFVCPYAYITTVTQ
jgi:hypothetical protein